MNAKKGHCWRCDKAWEGDMSNPLKIILLAPHALPGLDIKLRVPANICDSCAYALKIKMEFECQVFAIKKVRSKDLY